MFKFINKKNKYENKYKYEYTCENRLIYALRSYMVDNNHKIYIFNVKKFSIESNISNSMILEDIKLLFKGIYINNDNLIELKKKNEKTIGNFTIKYNCNNDYNFIESSEIKIISKYKSLIKFGKDLLLFTLLKGDKISISGTIELTPSYIVSKCGYDDEKKILNIKTLPVYNVKNAIKFAHYMFLKNIEIFKLQFNSQKTIENIGHNNIYIVTYFLNTKSEKEKIILPDKIEHTLLELITYFLNKNNNIKAGYTKNIFSRSNFSIKIITDKKNYNLMDDIILSIIDELISKYKQLIKTL